MEGKVFLFAHWKAASSSGWLLVGVALLGWALLAVAAEGSDVNGGDASTVPACLPPPHELYRGFRAAFSVCLALLAPQCHFGQGRVVQLVYSRVHRGSA
jgi:hypothetical protein